MLLSKTAPLRQHTPAPSTPSSPSRLPHDKGDPSEQEIEQRGTYEDPGETGSSNGQEHHCGFLPSPHALGRITAPISDGELVAAHAVPVSDEEWSDNG